MTKQYLTEKSLGHLLQVLFGVENVKAQYRITIDYTNQITRETKPRKLFIDYCVVNNNKTYFVEFDGYRHYQSSVVQERDILLGEYCKKNKIELINIPYFVQPDIYIFNYLFDKAFPKSYFGVTTINKGFSAFITDQLPEIDWEYPHGFHEAKCLRPADFNINGWLLFYNVYKFLNKIDAKAAVRSIYKSLTIDTAPPNSTKQDLIFPIIWIPLNDIDKDKSPSAFMRNYPK